MNLLAKAKTLVRRNLPPLLLIAIGVGLWWFTCRYIGEKAATSVGPDYLAKIGIAFVRLGVAWLIQRCLMRVDFHTIWKWSARGEQPISEFTRIWSMDPKDPRLDLTMRAYLNTWLVAALISVLAT